MNAEEPASRKPARRVGRGTGIALQLVGAVLLTGLLLVAAELTARAYLAHVDVDAKVRNILGIDYVSAALTNIDLAPDRNPTPLVSDPILLWRNKPLAEKIQAVNPRPPDSDAVWRIFNDVRGFRDDPDASATGVERPVFRVLCIGDSITFGFNVDQDATYPRALQRRLAERLSGRRVEVINAGVPGWSWVQGRTFLELEGLGLRPDVVVIGHGTNDQFYAAKVTDLERIGSARSTLGRLRAQLAALLGRTAVWRAAVQLAGQQGPRESPGCHAQIAATGSCHRVAIGEIADQVRAVDALARSRGVDLVVINVDFTETPAVAGVRAGIEATGLPFLDLAAEFSALRRAAEDERAAHLHLQPARTRVVGDPSAPRSIVLRVLGDRPGVYSAVGEQPYGKYTFDLTLNDDGIDGDEVAGDSVWSGTLAVPVNVSRIELKFHRDGVPELVSVPPLPSNFGSRVLPIDGPAVAPIFLFGKPYLMAEQTHPNAEGTAVIADRVAATIAGLPAAVRASSDRTLAQP